ncbi:MAG: alanine:cation symporter family protein, partial [Nannocystaceae bacterium]
MLADVLQRAADLIWSVPVVGLCLIGAIFFTLQLGFVQLRAFPHAIALLRGTYDREDETGTLSHFQALMAALSGTIGIGNIGGVAIAIAMGGPGAVLWMWVFGLFAMATKFV